MKKTLLVGLFVSLATALGMTSALAGTNPNGKPFVSINNEIVEVKGAVSTLEEQVELLLAASETMEGRLASLEQASVSLGQQNVTLLVLVSNNLTSLDSIQAEIDLLTQDVGALKAQVAASTGDVTALQAEILEDEALIASLQSAINMANQNIIDLNTSLSAQVDNNNAKISLLESQIAQVEADLAMKQNLVNGSCPNGEAVQEILPDGSVVCGAAGGGVSGQLETVYSYVQLFAYPNQRAFGIAKCPAGYNITGAGYASANNWTVHGVYPEIGAAGQYAVLDATNRGTVQDDIIPVATCSRLAP